MNLLKLSEVPAVLAEIKTNYSRYPAVMSRVAYIRNLKNALARARALTALVAELDRWEGPSGIH